MAGHFFIRSPRSARGDSCQKADQEKYSAEELDARNEGRKDLRGGDMPTDKILRDSRQILQFAPAAPQEFPTHDEPGKKRRKP
jgi:hypothetical protein